jgi:hypothetical protein
MTYHRRLKSVTRRSVMARRSLFALAAGVVIPVIVGVSLMSAQQRRHP